MRLCLPEVFKIVAPDYVCRCKKFLHLDIIQNIIQFEHGIKIVEKQLYFRLNLA
jgi:hypothetical protein